MASPTNPYSQLPNTAFWRRAVSDRHFSEMEQISRGVRLHMSDRIATAGSCFAQHIGRHLRGHGLPYLDMEPQPDFLTKEEALNHGFGIYSCRYGNIYTVRQLRQLVQEALGERTPKERVWTKGDRYFDALRPSVDPVGHDTIDRVLQLRRKHLAKVLEMLRQVDVFVFTLGLTESWILKEDETAYPMAPGTICGTWQPEKYAFKNFRYPEIYEDLVWFRQKLKSFNSRARMLLTVSPVPLVATASGEHVLPATVHSKSTLRAAAGDMARDFDDVYYFPSYELISAHQARGAFYDPDLRTVNDFGVRLVMDTFFQESGLGQRRQAVDESDSGIICDEERLDRAA
ncbi:MAG: GSCFA domain-containing protein [Vitreoscilla sp.]|nr:GSCFA domain-containing protein [Vitreoscilla sp.]